MNIPKKQPESKDKTRAECIEERLNQMPEIYRKTYLKATKRQSRSAADKIMCLECMGYEKEEIKVCPDLGCPLYEYRAFKTSRKRRGGLKLAEKSPK